MMSFLVLTLLSTFLLDCDARLIFDLVDFNGAPTLNGSGLLVVYHHEHPMEIGTVCDDSFNHDTASVICSTMGYSCSANWAHGQRYPVQVRLPILLDDVICRGNEKSIEECTYNTDHNCGHTEDVFLTCERLCDYTFSLVQEDGSPSNDNSGLLIASKVGTDINGTVCDDQFSTLSAVVICNEMGISCASTWTSSPGNISEVQASYSIILDDVTCEEGATNFSDCSFKSTSNCQHGEDIYLTCGCLTDKYEFHQVDETGAITTRAGLLVAQKIVPGENPGPMGTVCDNGFSTDSANEICAIMGHRKSHFWINNNWEVQQSYDILLDELRCSGEECTYSEAVGHGCTHQSDVLLACADDGDEEESTISFHTVGMTNEITNNGSGLLIASRKLISGSSGTVCDDLFSTLSATIICKSMNFTCSMGWEHGLDWPKVQNKYDIHLDDVSCGPGNKTFADCSYKTENNCGHSEDVFISCVNDCSITFALIDSNGTVSTNGQGLLIANHSSLNKTGTVCDDGMTDVTATVLCNALGYKCMGFWKSHLLWDIQESMDVALDNVRCSDVNSTFEFCSYDVNHNCAHQEDIFLYCANDCTGEVLDFHLVDSRGEVTTNGKGLLIADRNINGVSELTGTVCDDDFNEVSAELICKEMNFNCSLSFTSALTWPELQNNYTIAMDNVQCTSGDGTFTERCSYHSSHNCGHGEDIFLVCGAGESCDLKNHSAVSFTLVTEEGDLSTTGSGLLIATTVLNTGTVCDDSFNDYAATAICRTMGYNCSASWKSGNHYPSFQEGQTIALDNVKCSTDNFTECSYVNTHNCGHTEDIFLSCADLCLGDNLDFRLVDESGRDSTDGEGLLLAFSTVDDVVGTVCNEGFTAGSMICKKLGYSCQTSWHSLSPFDPGSAVQDSYNILLSHVNCEPGSRDFTECTYSTSVSCGSHAGDVFLSCGGERNIALYGTASQIDTGYGGVPSRAIDGITDGHYFSEDESVTHTNTGGDRAWWKVSWNHPVSIDTIKIYNRVDCCQDRLDGATVQINNKTVATLVHSYSESIYTFSDLGETATEVVIWGGASSPYLSLAEVEVFGDAALAKQCSVVFNLVDSAGNPSKEGLLLAHWQGYDITSAGTVCDDMFSDQAAQVVCKDMGYICASHWTIGKRWEMQDDYQIVLDDVRCEDSDLPFSNCTYSTMQHDCQHSEDVFLACDDGLIDLGCWRDNQEPAIPSLEGSNPASNVSWYRREDPIETCRQATVLQGWTVFAVQAGGWCASAADAGETYTKYGRSTACGPDGEGGPWANEVYRYTAGTGLESLGCWKDTKLRAIPSLEYVGKHELLVGEYKWRDDPVNLCKAAAQDSGFSVFAVQDGGRCLSSADAESTYQTYGASTDCAANGEGGRWANQVYRIKEDACKDPVHKFKFSLVNEKGKPTNYTGLLIAQRLDNGGQTPGTVCDDSFTDIAGTVICNGMGYACYSHRYDKHWEIQKQYPIVLDDVNCQDINKPFSNCTYKLNSNCGHTEDIFLACSDTCEPPTIEFSLIDAKTGEESRSGQGLLIASWNTTDDHSNQIRGTVCDDLFTLHTASVLCQELGYACARDFYNNRDYEGVDFDLQTQFSTVLDNVNCSSTSTHFSNCSYTTTHNCGHVEDVYLSCKKTLEKCQEKDLYTFKLLDSEGNDATEQGHGLLVANRTLEQSVGTVCDDRFNSTAADVMCMELGFSCSTAYYQGLKYQYQEDMSIIIDNVECGEHAEHFSQCSHRLFHDCHHNEDIFLICEESCNGPAFSFYLVDEEGHQIHNGEGLLLAHTLSRGYTGGTVCGNGFTANEAATICRQMGYDHVSNWHTNGNWGIQNIYMSLLNNVSCPNSKSDFVNCTFDYDTECGHGTDVFLTCEPAVYNKYMCPGGSENHDTACLPCPQNTYKTLYDDSPCLPCPSGSVSQPGSESCVVCSGELVPGKGCVCDSGMYFDYSLSRCVKCLPDTHSPDGLECVPCSSSSTAGVGAAECSCRLGTIVTKTGECQACPDGSVAVNGNYCAKCPDGVGVADGGLACNCSARTHWDESSEKCEECPAGKYTPERGHVECVQCPLYTTSAKGSSKCHSCEEGQSWNDYVCKDCPVGSHGNGIFCTDDATSHALSAARSPVWRILVGVICVVVILCVVLIVLVVKLRRRVAFWKNKLQGEEGVFEMQDSNVVQFTDIDTHDTIQLLPPDN